MADLRKKYGIKPGSKVSFDVWRDGRKQAIGVTVGELKVEQLAAGARGEAGSAADTGKLGLAVRPSEDGLVVEKAAGPAARAGIRAGDVVTAVNGRPVKSAGDLSAATQKTQGTVALLVRRGEATLFVPVEIG